MTVLQAQSRGNPSVADITVMGAGPVGLIAAFWAGMRETSVYPERWSDDVRSHPRIMANDLRRQA